MNNQMVPKKNSSRHRALMIKVLAQDVKEFSMARISNMIAAYMWIASSMTLLWPINIAMSSYLAYTMLPKGSGRLAFSLTVGLLAASLISLIYKGIKYLMSSTITKVGSYKDEVTLRAKALMITGGDLSLAENEETRGSLTVIRGSDSGAISMLQSDGASESEVLDFNRGVEQSSGEPKALFKKVCPLTLKKGDYITTHVSRHGSTLFEVIESIPGKKYHNVSRIIHEGALLEAYHLPSQGYSSATHDAGFAMIPVEPQEVGKRSLLFRLNRVGRSDQSDMIELNESNPRHKALVEEAHEFRDRTFRNGDSLTIRDTGTLLVKVVKPSGRSCNIVEIEYWDLLTKAVLMHWPNRTMPYPGCYIRCGKHNWPKEGDIVIIRDPPDAKKTSHSDNALEIMSHNVDYIVDHAGYSDGERYINIKRLGASGSKISIEPKDLGSLMKRVSLM